MTDLGAKTKLGRRLAKAQIVAAKWQAVADRLRAEIAARRASGRASHALARAEASLPAAEARAVKALGVVEDLTRKLQTKAAHAAQVERRFGRLDAQAAKTMTRWAQERKDEPKKIAKRRKHLAKRVSQDAAGSPEKAFFGLVRPRSFAPAPVEAETFPTGPIVPFVGTTARADVARPGLEPGDYRLVDRSPHDIDRYRPPQQWTARHVGLRLVEAHDVLRRLPMTTGPKAEGSNWPEYIHEAGELAIQAGAGTLWLGRKRVRLSTTADEIARMHEVLGWLLEFQAIAPALNAWAFDAAIGRRDGGADDPPKAFISDLQMIADALNARGVVVR